VHLFRRWAQGIAAIVVVAFWDVVARRAYDRARERGRSDQTGQRLCAEAVGRERS
jgi:hypothetical protein